MTRWAETRAGLGAGSGLDLVNHSGLAPDSRVSPVQMAAILRAAAGRTPGPLAAPETLAAKASTFRSAGLNGREGGGAGAPAASMPAATAQAAPADAGPSGRGDPGLLEELMKDVSLKARKGEPKLPGAASASAKTGTLHYVRALAGYLTAVSGRRYAFAIFSEDLDRRRAMANRDSGDAYSRTWLGRAKKMERDILRGWAARM